MVSDKKLIGNQEWCSFESLNIPAIKARIDSGAKTSSIQSSNIKRFKKGKELWVSFDVNPIQDNLSIVIRCESKVIDVRVIKSSSGITDKRYVIKEVVKIGEDTFEMELTLANRDGMDFRMLLGREAMEKRFLVDPIDCIQVEKSFPTARYNAPRQWQIMQCQNYVESQLQRVEQVSLETNIKDQCARVLRPI